MKKITSIFLLVCLFIFESGYLMLFILRQLELKDKMHAYILANPGKHGVSFTFELKEGEVIDTDFEWEEAGREFSFKGRMYDIVASKTESDVLAVQAYNDADEEQLLEEIAHHHQQKKNIPLTELLTLVFISPDDGLQLYDPSFTSKQNMHYRQQQEQLIPLGVLSPPPETA